MLLRLSSTIQTKTTGMAKPMRQKAVATGPISLRRTKIGDRAMPSAPTRRAIRAMRAVRSAAAVSWWAGWAVMGEGVVGITVTVLLRGGGTGDYALMDTGLPGLASA